ncbi:MacB family efflux pump subunit [Agrobacterium rhizogenes]|uniref:Pyoverdine export ATP-binding/permease protein PvdT n=1 Tax=Rhizobium rhizogenes NBRC 13257 TaxID=1220581 RepID=A0AA87Q6G1_RHIRH|nr:MacB family efflux pump subunit [Rhizobium rhizogenes]OCJ10562.1 macrolide ABC transporter permease/ATP-binding protein MacB [Agrobacterium sp. B131/95]OCJ15406.1 macrolide ABC transporter permease/ATP-binding protein MacB [Agrobacterium sp. B133/95]KEA09035.1 macrolide transporter [Rhizobium rhizogenes]MDJ1633702.1 MacB family efflux pump subunit [Rhizobium rhizogenes]MQB30948.1 MacB family efflux pump subunit [Rhizobium rhizogenes]
MSSPLIELKGVRREYQSGDRTIAVLKDVDLSIAEGEMVAIVGPSGSGKSTLMNIIGLLDRPTNGTYAIAGSETHLLDSDALSQLRREHFGFIFQRYHLLSELTALGNVEVPAIYAGQPGHARSERATALLQRLGMAERSGHRPGQLSGGQQQRVSIARALMNNGQVILADEPTGALDRESGEEVLRILAELHAEGHTVIIVTHDMTVAARADRIIEISDGEIVADRRSAGESLRGRNSSAKTVAGKAGWRELGGRLTEAFLMAVLALKAHRLRTFLTMLGIIIGIASVVCVIALGEGSQRKVLSNINNLGTNTLEIFPGKSFGDMRSGRIKTLMVSDADALAKLTYVAAVTPTVSTSSTVRFGSTEANALINGVGDAYFSVKGSKLVTGRLFDNDSVQRMAQDAVIDQNTATTLFEDKGLDPLGQTIFIAKVPVRVIGVIASQQGGFGSSDNLSVYLPYTSVQARFLGDMSLRSITVRVSDDTESATAEAAVTQFLEHRHKARDFFILNTDDIRQAITSTIRTMTLLVSAIAVISLLVGGIGVMNIMLVSVSERIAEIGVRMAVGARRQDILQQFLIEAVLVCLLGGGLGIAVALGFGFAFNRLGSNFTLVYSVSSIVLAFTCSCMIGLTFGYLPARNASRLDPVAALSRD